MNRRLVPCQRHNLPRVTPSRIPTSSAGVRSWPAMTTNTLLVAPSATLPLPAHRMAWWTEGRRRRASPMASTLLRKYRLTAGSIATGQAPGDRHDLDLCAVLIHLWRRPAQRLDDDHHARLSCRGRIEIHRSIAPSDHDPHAGLGILCCGKCLPPVYYLSPGMAEKTIENLDRISRQRAE